MNINKQFSWYRLGLFIKSDLVINSPKIFTFGLTALVALLLYSLITLTNFQADNFHPNLFALILFLGGLWLTSNSFADLHTAQKNQNFLLLPASNFEKLLGRLLLTTIGYIAGTVLIFYIVSLLDIVFTWFTFGKRSVIFQPLHQDIIHYLANYIILQSIFFLGAIYFKSNNFSKTNLCLCCLALGFFLITSGIFSIFLGTNFLDGWRISILHNTKIQSFFTVILPPAAWLIAYLRLCESET